MVRSAAGVRHHIGIGCVQYDYGGTHMSILVRFTAAPSLTAEKYDETQTRIEAAGKFPPDGLELHVAFSAGGSFRVSEIWDSKEQFEAFGERLMPILTESGVELAGPPEIIEIHNIIRR
jgi:hypothetical protein